MESHEDDQQKRTRFANPEMIRKMAMAQYLPKANTEFHDSRLSML